ncbi:MAG TPA: ABC transporter ATP-binding protein [Acidimicrobiales bacterium]|nr:ABC transporter ATP-binding protein [Acidimicrobiales bacterium]
MSGRSMLRGESRLGSNRGDKSDSSKTAGVRFEHVTKEFGGQKAVDDLSLEVQPGEFFSLLGPSGCGKTTSLRMLGGFEEPTSGRLLIGGEDVTDLPPYRRNVNTVFQSYALFPHLDVFNNVAFGLKRTGVDRAEIKRRVGEMLEMVDLPGFGERQPAQLSGGQQQRVALARALVNQPKLLLLDEPMSALDAKLRRQMQVELKRIQSQVGITFIYVTHDQEEAMTMSDRLAVMWHGKIEGLGTPKDVYDNPTSEFVATFLGASNLLSGEIVRTDGDRTTVMTTGGVEVTVPTDRVPDVTMRLVKVGVRPEKIDLCPEGTVASDGVNSLRGRVRVSTFTGVGNQYIVETESGVEVTVYAQNIGSQFAPRSGDNVVLTWPEEHTFTVRPLVGNIEINELEGD